MNVNYKNLGKVCVTPNGYWQRMKNYERISIVTDKSDGRSYISKKDVPAGVNIDNEEYWLPIGSGGYKDNNIIVLNDTNDDGSLKTMTLLGAVSIIGEYDRKPGTIISFYGKDNNKTENANTWYLYQFNSNDISNWGNLSYWQSVYDNVDHFKGYFIDIETLKVTYPFPSIGDFAFVGINLNTSLFYNCTKAGVWNGGKFKALTFIDEFKGLQSKDVNEINVNLDEIVADRALKDADGNVITDTYVTISSLYNHVRSATIETINKTAIPSGMVTIDSLSDSVKEYIGSGGNIINAVDDEDVTTKNNLIKFADKKYDANTYSGLGRIYLRKNIIDGKNIVEQNMFISPYTKYIIQYDYDLNGQTINIPVDCILDFSAGGSFNNGTINCVNSVIIAPYSASINVNCEGTYKEFGNNSSEESTTDENIPIIVPVFADDSLSSLFGNMYILNKSVTSNYTSYVSVAYGDNSSDKLAKFIIQYENRIYFAINGYICEATIEKTDNGDGTFDIHITTNTLMDDNTYFQLILTYNP